MPRQVLVLSQRGGLLEGLLRASLRHPVDIRTLDRLEELAALQGPPPALVLLDAAGAAGPDRVRQAGLLRSALPTSPWVILAPDQSPALRLALELGLGTVVPDPVHLDRFAQVCREALASARGEGASLDALAVVLRGLNHEVRNPLASVSGLLQLLSHDEPEDSDRGTRYRRMLQEVARIQEVLDQFSHFLRHQRPARERLPLGDVLTSLEQTARERAHPCALRWLDEVQQVPVMVDRPAFVEALAQLVAFAAGPQPGGPVLCQVTAGPELVELELRGDAPVRLPDPPMRLFVPYHADSGPGPTGSPGLASAYGILRGHEADVAVAPTATRAVEFRILLPRAVGPAVA